MAYHFFYWASNLQNIPPFEQVFNKIKTKTLQVCLSQFYQGLWFSSESKFAPLQGDRHFSRNYQRCSKNLSSKYLKDTCEGVAHKKWVIHRCFLRVLVVPNCWKLYKLPFSMTPFLLQHINRICFRLSASYWRLTFSLLIIKTEKSKEMQ